MEANTDYKRLLSRVLFYFIEESSKQIETFSVDEIDWDEVFNNTINSMNELEGYSILENDNIVDRIYSDLMSSEELGSFKKHEEEHQEEIATYEKDPLGYFGMSTKDFI